MSDPRITVYLPSRNYGRFLEDAIVSVMRQSVDDWELIVIDDGSTDETSEVMNRFRGHPKISLHRTEGIGLTAVCNYALARARGHYVIRLDGDDLFDENILLVLGNMLDRDEKLALVFPDYYLVDPFGEVISHERREKIFSTNHMPDLPPNGACTLIRASVLRGIGGYREDLGAQDGFDLWSKVASRHKCANVNLPLFYYRRHDSNLTIDSQRIISARREIKKDAAKDQLDALRPIIAFIPCRQNFDFTPDLWAEIIGGRSLLDRDIGICLSSPLFDHVVVACDNPAAEETVRKHNDPRLRFFLRDPKSTFRMESIVPTMEMVARLVDAELNGITVLRYIQTPFVSAATIEEAITTLATTDADSANGAEEIHSQVFRRRPHGLEVLNPRSAIRSDFDIMYRDVQTCVATRNRNLAKGTLRGKTVACYVVNAAESFFIDSEQKLQIARLMTDAP